MKGFTIGQFEAGKPETARFDEVRYSWNSGQAVKSVIGTVKVFKGNVQKLIIVEWDENGLCFNKRSKERMPEHDIKL